MVSFAETYARTDRPGNFAEMPKILDAIWRLAGGGLALDLGCGEAHVTHRWPGVTLVDLIPQLNPKVPVIPMDIRDAPTAFQGKHFCLLTMLDVIEHLTRPDAETLLAGMEPICGASVIFTPMGPFRMDPDATGPHDHKSGWWPREFHERGWEVWAWSKYHQYPGGEILGAFYAWKFRDRATPTVEQVCLAAGLGL